MFIIHSMIIVAIMFLVASIIFASTKIMEMDLNNDRALRISISCATFVGIMLVLFDISLNQMAMLLS